MIREKGPNVARGQTPYQKIMTAPRAGATPYTPVQQPIQQAPPQSVAPPARPHPPIAEKNKLKSLFKGNTRANHGQNSPDAAIDSDTGSRMALIAIGFLIFYVLLMWSILQNDYNRSQDSFNKAVAERSLQSASHISSILGSVEVSINTGLSEGATPVQAARLIAKAPHIDAAVILDAQKQIISSFPEKVGFITDLALNEVSPDAMTIQSSTSIEKDVTTLVVKRAGDYFAVAAIKNESLNLGSSNGMQSVVATRSEQVIAGNRNFGLNGVSDGLGILSSRFNQMIGSGVQSSIRLKADGQRRFFSTTQIPNSDLFLLTSTPANSSIFSRKNLLLFLTLFLGISTLTGLMLNSIFSKIRSLKAIQKETEVSRQRFQAAVEGDRGGVWEIDLANNIAYISASLASLLGLPRSEHKMPTDQFLGLFHPQDRERFLAFARRAHMQGEFDFDMNVAHLPLILNVVVGH